MNEAEKLSRIFKVLSVPARVRLIQTLKGRCLCVNVLSSTLGMSSAAASQHLRVLREADLVVPEKRGYFVHYRLNEDTLDTWREQIDRLLNTELDTSDPDSCFS